MYPPLSDTEEELQEEKRKMYEAIGYSQNAELPIYPKEVSRLSTIRSVKCVAALHMQ